MKWISNFNIIFVIFGCLCLSSTPEAKPIFLKFLNLPQNAPSRDFITRKLQFLSGFLQHGKNINNNIFGTQFGFGAGLSPSSTTTQAKAATTNRPISSTELQTNFIPDTTKSLTNSDALTTTSPGIFTEETTTTTAIPSMFTENLIAASSSGEKIKEKMVQLESITIPQQQSTTITSRSTEKSSTTSKTLDEISENDGNALSNLLTDNGVTKRNFQRQTKYKRYSPEYAQRK